EVLREWIREGALSDHNEARRCVGIEVFPRASRVLHFPRAEQQLRVTATYSDGSRKDVTALASYSTSEPRVASAAPNGLVTGRDRGEAALVVRYLDHVESTRLTFVREIPGFAWNDPDSSGYIDRLVHEKLKTLQYLPSEICRDEVFLRRVYLDATGLLPPADVAERFLDDESPDKRPRLIDRLLDSPEYARFWALKMSDRLQVNPQLLPQGGDRRYGDWILQTVKDNMPFDQFARELLTASGKASVVPAVHYFSIAPNTDVVTETTSQLFLGSRLQCAKCHNHPFEKWTQDDYYSISAAFAQVQRKNATAGNKKVMEVALGAKMKITHPVKGHEMAPWPPTEKPMETGDRRRRFADWLTRPGNPYFAKVEVNRIWAEVMGRGLVEPVDDFRSSNPPTNSPLLNALAEDFENSEFDRKHVLRTILNSRVYQRSSLPNDFNKDEERLGSRNVPRLLVAEQLLDAIVRVSDPLENDRRAKEQLTKLQEQRDALIEKHRS
ncbi:MAG: DUF1549 domain-containing protein, partial [Planctomycetales bacterium]